MTWFKFFIAACFFASFIPSGLSFAQSPEAKSVAALVNQLTVMKVEGENTQLPDEVQAPYNQLKRRLPELVLVNLQALGNTPTAAAQLKTAVSKDLQQAGVSFVRNKEPVLMRGLFGILPAEKNDKQPLFFSLDSMNAVVIEGHEDLIGVVTAINVPCGLDEAFYLYQFKNKRWELVLVQNDAGGGFQENLGAEVMDGPGKGDLYVVTGSNGTWCTSCWSSLDLLALRPAGDPFQPETIGKFEKNYYRCDGFGMEKKGNILKVLYRTEDPKFPGNIITALDEYRLDGGKFKSVPWKVEDDRIKKSIVRIYAQGDKYLAVADKMKTVLEKKGFRVKTASVETYIKKQWTNTVRYFHYDDDDLAIYVNSLVYDILANGYDLLDEINLTEEFKDTHVENGAIEIWICDPEENKKLDTRDSWDERS